MATEQSISYYERINRIKEYIRQHMDEPLNRDELAQLSGYSIVHFHHPYPVSISHSG